jgi:hypothetical protein
MKVVPIHLKYREAVLLLLHAQCPRNLPGETFSFIVILGTTENVKSDSVF